jgi:hypothetical protein
MRRPSRGFLAALVLAILVAVAALGLWMRETAPKPWDRPTPPDVWEREDAPGDLRSSPDGPVVVGWTYMGRGVFEGAPRDHSKEFVVLLPGSYRGPSAAQGYWNRLTGADPMQEMKDRQAATRHLNRRRESFVTPTGRWWNYSSKWWLPATLPPK